MKDKISRRQFLEASGIISGVFLLDRCSTPTVESEDMKAQSISIGYHRIGLKNPSSAQVLPILKIRRWTPSGWDPSSPDAYLQKTMTASDTAFVAYIDIYKNGQNVVSIEDPGMFDGTSNSGAFVAKNISVSWVSDGIHTNDLVKTSSMGPADWCGVCVFTIHPGDSLTQP